MAGIKESIFSEINKISQMDRGQKLEYFKSYYLVKTIFLVIGIILLVWFIKDTFLQKEIVNAGCVYGVELSEAEREALTDGYLRYYNYNPKKYASYVSTDNMFEDTEQKMDANTHEMALFAQIAASEVYYLILDKKNLNRMASGGIYLSLEDAFQGNIPEAIAGSLVELEDSEGGKAYPAAVDLRKAGILDKDREGYLVFTVGIPDKDYPTRFINYLTNK